MARTQVHEVSSIAFQAHYQGTESEATGDLKREVPTLMWEVDVQVVPPHPESQLFNLLKDRAENAEGLDLL